jgi:hypothetical protein
MAFGFGYFSQKRGIKIYYSFFVLYFKKIRDYTFKVTNKIDWTSVK